MHEPDTPHAVYIYKKNSYKKWIFVHSFNSQKKQTFKRIFHEHAACTSTNHQHQRWHHTSIC